MKQTINFSQFCDSFSDSYKDNFSYYGKKALFEYLEQYEEDTEGEVELDTVALCCEYTEYEDLKEIQKSYPDIKSIEDLQDKTQVISFENDNPFMQGRTSGIIVLDF